MNHNNQHGYNRRMVELFGDGTELLSSQLATYHSVLKKMMLVKENMILQENLHFSKISRTEMSKIAAKDLSIQWWTLCPLLKSPVTLTEKGFAWKIKSLWEKAVSVSRGQTSRAVRESFLAELDKLFNITVCRQDIIQHRLQSGQYNLLEGRLHFKLSINRNDNNKQKRQPF